jgi:uncharacterized protein (DUF1330 family)
MKAYVIAAETIKDQAMFDDYRKVVPETLAPFGGRFMARGGNLTVLEGEWPHSRLVVIEFPSRADAEAWYKSPAYQKIISSGTGSVDVWSSSTAPWTCLAAIRGEVPREVVSRGAHDRRILV